MKKIGIGIIGCGGIALQNHLPGVALCPEAQVVALCDTNAEDVEFIRAILEQRPCKPSFADGAQAQAVMDAAVVSAREKLWVEVSA